MALVKVFAILVLTAGASCTTGRCDVDDQTSLMQFKQQLASGVERVEDPDAAQMPPQEVPEELSSSKTKQIAFEKFTLQDSPTPPPGCEDQGCWGQGPNCGGNENICTSNGAIATGYFKQCSAGGDTCSTGWKVRCAVCGAKSTAKSIPTAAPDPALAAAWVAPPLPTSAPGKPPTAPPAVVMPTDKPVFAAPVFDEQAVNQSTIALRAARAELDKLKATLAEAQKNESAVNANISKFGHSASDAHSQFEANRRAAVRYAKKRELANITILKAQQALANAYYAEKGAASGAQKNLADANNYGAQERYYEKVLVDKQHNALQAQGNLDVGKAAVRKAQDDLKIAKKAAFHAQTSAKSNNNYLQNVAAQGSKLAQHSAVKDSMEDAFIESSKDRNDTNVPPYGQ